MARLGYIRTSTDKQHTDRQVMQLRDQCDLVFIEDGVSATRKNRPVYNRVMSKLKTGDVFVVSSLDRAFRSSLDALSELEKLQQRGIQFLSLSQQFDTTTPEGKLLYTIAAALAEWERSIIRKRTKEGMAAARQRGSQIGRPRKLNQKQIDEARRILECEVYSSLTALAEHFEVHKVTLERALNP